MKFYNMSPDQVSYERNRDLYRLACMGEKQSARQWNDYAARNSTMARLIVKDCEATDTARTVANAQMDQFLVKAEKRLKPRRPKGMKKGKRSPDMVTKAAAPVTVTDPVIQAIYDEARTMRGSAPNFTDMQIAAYRIATARRMVRAEFDSPDPLRRKIAGGDA